MSGSPLQQPLTPAQERIADAAIRVIAKQGFDVVSVRTVAQEAGQSAGTVQYHYRTRQDLLTAALVRSAHRGTIRAEAAGMGTESYREALHAGLREFLPLDGHRHEDAAVWVSYAAAASTRDWLVDLQREALQSLDARLREVLTRAQDDGRLRAGLTAETAAPLVSALVNGLTLDNLNAPAEERSRADRALDLGLSLILSD